MKSIIALSLVLSLSACASFVEKCHEFSKYVDIKALDCASEKVDEKK
ncbi:MAG: hypothetical protein ACRCZI_03355 [Cetobacterium sp.]